jgi:hypothetical protein
MRMTSFFRMTVYVSLLVSSSVSFAQDPDFTRRSRQEVFDYEISQKGAFKDSVTFSLLVNPLLDAELLKNTKAYIFQRTADHFDPQLHVWYLFDPLNNSLAGIRYNWGLYNPTFSPAANIERLKYLSTREVEFSEKYKAVSGELELKYGEPLKSISIADNKDMFSEQTYWEDGEKIISLSIRFDRRLKEIPGAGVFADYKIEILVTYK